MDNYDIELAKFQKKKGDILAQANEWSINEKKYLEVILNEIEVMTVFYSYGNGDLNIGSSKNWDYLDESILKKTNELLSPSLGVSIDEKCSRFPEVLWFDTHFSITQWLEECLSLTQLFPRGHNRD